MTRYTTPPPTPHLALTLSYVEGEQPGVWIGRVAEIGGIIVQAENLEQLFAKAAEVGAIMLNRYKRPESFALLRQQGHDTPDNGQQIAFTISDGKPLPSLRTYALLPD